MGNVHNNWGEFGKLEWNKCFCFLRALWSKGQWGTIKFASVFSQTCHAIEPREMEMLPSLNCFTNNFSKDLFWNGTVTLKKMYSLAFEVESFSPDRRMEHQERESNKQFLIYQHLLSYVEKYTWHEKNHSYHEFYFSIVPRCFGVFEVWMANGVSKTVSSQTAHNFFFEAP